MARRLRRPWYKSPISLRHELCSGIVSYLFIVFLSQIGVRVLAKQVLLNLERGRARKRHQSAGNRRETEFGGGERGRSGKRFAATLRGHIPCQSLVSASEKNSLSPGGIYSPRLIWSFSTPLPSTSTARAARSLAAMAKAKTIGQTCRRWWWDWCWVWTDGRCVASCGRATQAMSPHSGWWSIGYDNNSESVGFVSSRTGG